MKVRILNLALVVFLFLPGCKGAREPKPQTVVVHCLEDPKGLFEPWLLEVTYKFSLEEPKTRSGRPILVATYDYDARRFERMLSQSQPSPPPDLIIASSASQISENSELLKELKDSKDVCPSMSPCLAFIPSWVPEEERDAASRYLEFLGRLAHH